MSRNYFLLFKRRWGTSCPNFTSKRTFKGADDGGAELKSLQKKLSKEEKKVELLTTKCRELIGE
jgi:hypothetical protein